MKECEMPLYLDVNQAISEASCELHPSEVHGLLCGILLGGLEKQGNWWQLVLGDHPLDTPPAILESVYLATKKQLDEFLFEFQLLLPPDTEDLLIRAEALTLWCQGYLSGLKLSDIQAAKSESPEAAEAIHDILEIAKMNYEDVVASEEDEEAYTELVEYVRMAVILVHQEIKEMSIKTEVKQENLH